MENLNYSAIIKAILNVAFAHFQLHIVERCECLPSETSDSEHNNNAVETVQQ